MRRVNVALAGNPNSGKTTIFNALTGSRQHVGNWPGKTVEKKTGRYSQGGITFEVIDLPGAYSLTAFSTEEMITRDFLITGGADLVVAVVDSSNLERNLYLVTQILELQTRLIIALNKCDHLEKAGMRIDLDTLSQFLGDLSVVRMVATRNEGLKDLKHTLVEHATRAEGGKEIVL
jgi:ferrous iron transport protein B